MSTSRKIKIGQLYEVRHKWLIPRWRCHGHDWQESEIAMYLGEKKVIKPHKRFEIKHELLVDGKSVEVDTEFLRYLEPVNESR